MWGYISSYWNPLTTCHSQDLGVSSQYAVSSRHIIGSVPRDLIIRLDDGHTCHSVLPFWLLDYRERD